MTKHFTIPSILVSLSALFLSGCSESTNDKGYTTDSDRQPKVNSLLSSPENNGNGDGGKSSKWEYAELEYRSALGWLWRSPNKNSVPKNGMAKFDDFVKAMKLKVSYYGHTGIINELAKQGWEPVTHTSTNFATGHEVHHWMLRRPK